MCDHDRQSFDRRALLRLAGLGLASAGLGLAGTAAHAAGKGTSLTADQALAALKDGNARFVSNPQACVMDLAKQRAEVAGGQAPWAIIVGCSDSRVPPELLFGGLGLGQLFVARNAGNMVDTATMGTIEYGAEHLGAPLVVVLGHESCGAVAAACDVLIKNAKLDGSMGPMVQPIVEVAKTLAKSGTCDVDAVIRESAIRTAKKVAGSPVLAHKKTKVVAARYDLDNGKVEFL
ncbi:MAG: carbonic anhydrase [Hyphomicrobiaceae bacterium]|jgi:carbonic anhydrase